MDSSKPPRPRVVIIGGGFGGLACAKALKRTPVDITLIDRTNHHCFQPLLYQVATAALAPNDIAWPIRSILRAQANATTLLAEIDGADLAAKTVRAGALNVPYDFLVLATGATHSYFGHDDWAPFAPGLKHVEDATAIRRRLLLSFERAELCDNETDRQRFMTFVIVGGGPTGVELAGAIAEVARHALPRDFRRIDPRQARILLIEAGPRVLPIYPENLSAYAANVLRKKGVEVRLNEAVALCDAEGVTTASGRIPSACVLWAAGVKASPAAAWLNAPHDHSGRVQVAPDLSAPGHGDVFVIGDAAALDPPAPGIAPAAKQMGAYVARRISATLKGVPSAAPFRYRHYGDLATIGRNAAVVKLDPFRLTGFLGWAFWSAAHIYFLIGARNRIAVAYNWLWDYLTFQRGVRLIIDPPPGARD